MSINIYNSGPIAPERNPDPRPDWFKPSRFEITAITLGLTTTLTTSEDHNYIVGQLVRVIIPFNYGTRGLNERQGYVVSLPSSTQVEIDINSRDMDAFIASPTFTLTPPSVSAIGDINTGVLTSTGRNVSLTTIPGSFQNISPSAGG